MRYIIGFFLAAFISTFTLYGSISSEGGYSWADVIIANGVWGLWIAAVVKAQQRKRKQKERERMLDEYLRQQIRR